MCFQGGLTTCSSGGISLRSIPAEDLEPRGEGNDVIVSGLKATVTMINLTCSLRLAKAHLQVVNVHVIEGHFLELARLGRLEPDTRDPVITLVVFNHGVGAL